MARPPDLQRMLAIDTSSRRACVGLFDEKGALSYRTSEEDASLSLFPLIKHVLKEFDWQLSDINSIAFCQGPGSMLGIRTAIMGIRTWQGVKLIEGKQIYSFSSLAIGAELVRLSFPSEKTYLIITDARRNSWNALKVEGASIGPVQIIDNAAIEAETIPLFSFNEFPTWTHTQAHIQCLSYRPENVLSSSRFSLFLEENPDSNPMDLRSIEFAKWIPAARTADQIKS